MRRVLKGRRLIHRSMVDAGTRRRSTFVVFQRCSTIRSERRTRSPSLTCTSPRTTRTTRTTSGIILCCVSVVVVFRISDCALVSAASIDDENCCQLDFDLKLSFFLVSDFDYNFSDNAKDFENVFEHMVCGAAVRALEIATEYHLLFLRHRVDFDSILFRIRTDFFRQSLGHVAQRPLRIEIFSITTNSVQLRCRHLFSIIPFRQLPHLACMQG